MLFVTKKIAAFTLIIAMTLTNAGVSTFATSVQYLTSSVESDAENLNKKDYRIYEEFKYEERSSVLLNGGGRLFGENNNLNVQVLLMKILLRKIFHKIVSVMGR